MISKPWNTGSNHSIFVQVFSPFEQNQGGESQGLVLEGGFSKSAENFQIVEDTEEASAAGRRQERTRPQEGDAARATGRADLPGQIPAALPGCGAGHDLVSWLSPGEAARAGDREKQSLMLVQGGMGWD